MCRTNQHKEEQEWIQVYEGEHAPSMNTLVELKLHQPIRLKQGERCGLYVHSARPGDDGIVYDNARSDVTYKDRVFKVHPGRAHLSSRPFGRRGMWGSAWRQRREFVGRISFGVRWRMWSPKYHQSFPFGFRETVKTMIMASRRRESLMYLLQDEVVLFIMNKCWWDSWGEALNPPREGQPAEEESEAEEHAPPRWEGAWNSPGYSFIERELSLLQQLGTQLASEYDDDDDESDDESDDSDGQSRRAGGAREDHAEDEGIHYSLMAGSEGDDGDDDLGGHRGQADFRLQQDVAIFDVRD